MMYSNPIGIMQGRLVPPVNGRIQLFPLENWRNEFEHASTCGIELIEWIFDTHSLEQNPIMSEQGIEQVKALSERYGIRVISCCADYFMEQPLIRVARSHLEERLQIFQKLVQQCERAGVQFIGIPFVDHAAIKDENEMRQACHALRQILPIAADRDIILVLETSLSPNAFRRFLDMLDHPNAKINYDTGNSASLGYDIQEEISAYGHAIATIHIKDRKLNGGTVPLGSGDVDFTKAFELFQEINYAGPLILQAAREEDELETAKKNLKFIKKYLKSCDAYGFRA